MGDLALLRATLRDLFTVRRLALSLLLAVLPAIIVTIWRTSSAPGDFHPEVAYDVLAGDLVFGFLLVLLAVIYATGILTQEVEGKTIVYLLTRPVPRWRILGVKFIGSLAAITVAVWIASALLAFCCFGAAGWSRSHLGRDSLILPVGALAYGSLFLLMAVLFRRPLLIGLLFAFGWESWAPNLPGSMQLVSLVSYLRVLAPHPQPENEAPDLSSLMTAANPESISRATAWEVLGIVTAVCLATALFLFSTREFVPRDEAG